MPLQFFIRLFPALVVLISLAGMPARADALRDAFPPPDWKQGKSQNGFGFDCLSESCGPRSQVFMAVAPHSPKFDENVASGQINREWAEKLAKSRARGPADRIRVLSFNAKKTRPVGFQMVYECACNGQISYVATRTISAANGAMTFISTAQDQRRAVAHMEKFIQGVLRASSSQ